MANPGLVLAEAHIEGPVQAILDSSMLPHTFRDADTADGRQAAEVVADFVRLAALVRDRGDHLHDRLQSRSGVQAAALGRQRGGVVFAPLAAAPALLVGDDLAVGLAEAPGVPRFEVPADIFAEVRMIVVEGQYVAAAPPR
jgi:hypothetical protein